MWSGINHTKRKINRMFARFNRNLIFMVNPAERKMIQLTLRCNVQVYCSQISKSIENKCIPLFTHTSVCCLILLVSLTGTYFGCKPINQRSQKVRCGTLTSLLSQLQSSELVQFVVRRKLNTNVPNYGMYSSSLSTISLLSSH